MRTVFLSYLFLSSLVLFGQQGFNQQQYFNSLSAIGNGIHVTDSCYYWSGLIVDTIDGNVIDGLVIAKVELNGEIDSNYKVQDTTYSYENWLTPFGYHDGTFTSVGYGFDSLMYTYWLKLDDNFNIIKQKRFRSYYYPNRNFTRPVDFFYSQNGSYYISTYTTYETPTEQVNIHSALMRINDEGEQLWQYPYGNNWVNEPLCLTSKNNNLYLGIEYANYNLTSLNKIYQTRIIAVDTAGQTQWSWTSPNETQQGANDIIAKEDGSLIVISGRGFLEYVNVQTNIMLWDRGLIFKLNAEQQVEWETEFTEPDPTFENRLNKLVPAIDETGYVGAGQMRLWLNDENASLLGWLVKVSPQGDSLWSRKLFYYDQTDSIEYEHTVHDLQSTPDGGYLLSGYTLDREGNQPAPRQRAWLLKVDSEGCLIPNCGLVDTKEPDEAEGPALLIYPNPADQYLNIYLGDNGGQKWTFLVFDGVGRQLGRYEAPLGQTTYMVPVDNYPAGSYYLQAVDEQGRRLKTYSWVKN